MLSRIHILASFFILWTILSTPLRAAVDPDSGRIVVLISLDGLAAYYLDDPKAEMPTLKALADGGARASAMKASNPTVTWPNHTTLVTGFAPARHGVLGNNYFDREAGKSVALICDPVFDKDQIVKVPTIYDLAKSQGLRTAAFRWPASRNAGTLDWTIPDVASNELLHKYSTPALIEECTKVGVWSDGKPQDNKENVLIVPDEACAAEFKYVLHNHRPNLALLHLIDIDHTQHLYGPRSPEAYAAVKKADEQVADVWNELKQSFPGKATLVIVSDHGFSPIEKMILPNVLLRDAGLVEIKGIRVVGGSVRLVIQGGSAMIYILDKENQLTVAEKIRKTLDGVEGIAKVVGSGEFKEYGVANPSQDPRAPDMIAFAKMGYSFGDTAGGALPFNAKPERKGGHGHDASLPELHATFVMWGAGVKPGAKLGEIENIDVASTIAKLLAIPMPNTDGKPLAAGLTE